jgi:hypothetical protein
VVEAILLLKEGKSFGSEEGKAMGNKLCYEYKKEAVYGLYCL